MAPIVTKDFSAKPNFYFMRNNAPDFMYEFQMVAAVEQRPVLKAGYGNAVR